MCIYTHTYNIHIYIIYICVYIYTHTHIYIHMDGKVWKYPLTSVCLLIVLKCACSLAQKRQIFWRGGSIYKLYFLLNIIMYIYIYICNKYTVHIYMGMCVLTFAHLSVRLYARRAWETTLA